MNKDLTLLIMAAGMGSRFGGLKQVEPMGPSGEFMIDYSIYDAIKAGFNKVVFIIKEENYDLFKETVGARVEKYIKTEYCFQSLSDLPAGYNVPESRVKPWGTGHAILAARNVIHENFAIINADDFYGRDAFKVMADYLKTVDKNKKEEYAVVGYKVINTLTENGSVKRGVAREENGYLSRLIESSIEKVNDRIIASPLDGSPSFELNENDKVSMNMLGFTDNLFKYLQDNFTCFLDESKDSIDTAEYLIPTVVEKAIISGFASVKVLGTTAKWLGVTYREDKPGVVKAIKALVDEGVYPEKLWK